MNTHKYNILFDYLFDTLTWLKSVAFYETIISKISIYIIHYSDLLKNCYLSETNKNFSLIL